MTTIIISNPVSGACDGHTFVTNHVLPLLEEAGRAIHSITLTRHPGHAGEIVLDHFRQFDGDLDVVLSSGDGTLHEIVNALGISANKGLLHPRRVSFALVPSGTANALYFSLFPPNSDGEDPIRSKLKAVITLIKKALPKPLVLARTTINFPGPSLQTVYSIVVTSTSLHASILHDSEELRKEHPDISRFKLAAAKNISRWYDSDVELLPTQGGSVQIYDNRAKVFLDYPPDAHKLRGPFQYFLSTVNVDRLEPHFQITPLQPKSISDHNTSMDIIAVRPLRDPSVGLPTDSSKEAFSKTAGTILHAAYAAGSHINLTYTPSGEVVADGDGPLVVEYFRCGGWSWTPSSNDPSSCLVCSDGDILHLVEGGQAICESVRSLEGVQLFVHGECA